MERSIGKSGRSLVGQMVVRSSVPDGFSEGSQRSKGGSDSFDDFSSAAQSAEKTLIFTDFLSKVAESPPG